MSKPDSGWQASLPGHRSPRWLTPLAVAALVVTAGWLALDAAAPRRLATIDEGQWLYYASAVRDGAVPYRDFWIQFGPVVLYAISGVWEVFGATVAAERWTVWALNGLALAAAGAGMALLTRSWRWAALAVLLLESNALICRALMINPAFLIRQCLPLLAIGLAALGWRSDRRAPFFAAGAVAGLALLTSQEVGLFGMAGLGAAALAACFLSPRSDVEASFGAPVALAVGAALPMGVWTVAALSMGGFGDYVSVSLVDTFAMVSAHQHQPLPGWRDLFAGPFRDRAGWMLAYLPFAVWVAVAGPVWRAWRRGDRALAALFVFACLLWSVNLGRSDRAHAAYAAGPTMALGIAVLANAAGVALRKSTAVAIVLVLASLWAASVDRQALLFSLGFQRTHLFTSDFPRSGGASIRVGHAARLRSMEAVMAERTEPGDPIFVTPHDPALYFLLRRANPTRFATPVFANRAEDRRGIVDDLDTRPPALIVRTRQGLLPGIDYDTYLGLLDPVFDRYCRDPHFRGPTEIWARRSDPRVPCADSATLPGR